MMRRIDKVLIVCTLVAIVFACCFTEVVVADDQDVGPSGGNIWVNVGFGSTSYQRIGFAANVTNIPDSWDVGVVVESATPSTAIDYFTITNNSAFAVNITIHGVDFTGGTTWTLSDDGSAGVNIVGLMAGLDDADDLYDVVVKKTAPFNMLKSGLAGGGGTQDWGIKMFVPTDMPEELDEKTGTVTLTGVVP